MHTVFSHIVQKRLSQATEDVATDALSFILDSSEPARSGMMKLLRGIVADLPALQFRTQQTEGSIRPDLWGLEGIDPRVFIENKFWAGLTDNQPDSYLQQLASYRQPSLLLFVAPAAREHTLWRELSRRLADAGVPVAEHDAAPGIARAVVTELGPVLALTSWTNVLSALEHEVADDPRTKGDLAQLRALCDAADVDAFAPVSMEELTDQRTPALVLQLGSIVQAAVDLAVTENALDVTRLMPQASWERVGRYAKVLGGPGVGVWVGIHLGLWKSHGETPLWLLFSEGEFGRASQVRPLVEPWAAGRGILTTSFGGDFAVALDVPAGEEKPAVVRSLVDDIKAIASVLDTLPSEGWAPKE
jgi:hypothetical protein